MIYEILSGENKGLVITKPQDRKTMERLIEKGLIRVKEEKHERETKELKKEVEETKPIKRRRRVSNKR
jgi:hypothetical protein